MGFATRQLRNFTTGILPGACNPMRVFRYEGNPGRAPTRRYYSNTFPESQLHQLRSEMKELIEAVSSNVVALLSYFSGSETREIQHSARRGTGVFVDPLLILTSARVVGKVSTVFDSDRRSILHNCFIGRTIAVNGHDDDVLCTSPVAVNFAGDVAVLKVLNPDETIERIPCAVANGIADANSTLFGITRHQNSTALSTILPGHRKGVEKRERLKAPWPLDDELEWVDFNVGETNDSVVVSLADTSGSPWFNMQKEVVGMASWAAETADGHIDSFAVPPSSIRSIIDYAKTKGPHDPVIMDPWINAHSFPDHDLPISKECVPSWPMNIMVQMYV